MKLFTSPFSAKKVKQNIIVLLSLSLSVNGMAQESSDQSHAGETKRFTINPLKSYSAGIRLLHLYDLPSYRFDTDLSRDMKGLNGSKTRFDVGIDLYAEKQFTPLLGVQLGFRYGQLTGANEVEYYKKPV